MLPYQPSNLEGYTGTGRRGCSLSPPGSQGVVKQPCPTCGQLASISTYQSTRPDGVYQVTELRCPSFKGWRKPTWADKLNGRSNTGGCPLHKTEIKIGETTMPPFATEACITPDPKDQADYQRLKSSLGFTNKEFLKRALMSSKALYDFFAGLQITSSTQARIRKTLQDMETHQIAKESNGAVCNPKAETPSNEHQTPKCDAALANCEDRPFEVRPERLNEYRQATELAELKQRVTALEAEADAEPEFSGDQLDRIQFADFDQLDRKIEALTKTFEARCFARQPIVERIEELERHRHDLHEMADSAGADIQLLMERSDRLEAKLAKIEAGQGNAVPKTNADKAQLAIDLLTHLSDTAVNCIYEVVRSRKTLMASHATLSKAVGQ